MTKRREKKWVEGWGCEGRGRNRVERTERMEQMSGRRRRGMQGGAEMLTICMR